MVLNFAEHLSQVNFGFIGEGLLVEFESVYPGAKGRSRVSALPKEKKVHPRPEIGLSDGAEGCFFLLHGGDSSGSPYITPSVARFMETCKAKNAAKTGAYSISPG